MPLDETQRPGFGPGKPMSSDQHWIVDGVYDEFAARLRVEKANAEMANDKNYANNIARIKIEKRLEQRALESEIAEYY